MDFKSGALTTRQRCLLHAAFGVLHHNIRQYSFYLWLTIKRVAFPDSLSVWFHYFFQLHFITPAFSVTCIGDVSKTKTQKRRPKTEDRRPCGLKRRPTGLKRRPCGLKRRPTGLKRRPTGLKRRPTGLKRRPTGLKRRPTGRKPFFFRERLYTKVNCNA